MERYDIIIIGGGASGLCTAIMAKTRNNKILIIEHNDRVGKKILSTGNGKCNLTNLYCMAPEGKFVRNPEGIEPFYTSGDPAFAGRVIASYDAGQSVEFFENLGMAVLNKNGYIYPRSEQAASVLDLLRFKCLDLGVDILCGYQPVKVERFSTQAKGQNVKQEEAAYRFCIDKTYLCRNLVISTGGKSASKTGSDGTGYEIARRLGHTIIKPVPALCALKCSDKFFKELAGVRTDAELTLYELAKDKRGDRKPLMTVSGNLQFNAYGISGIPVFQMSLLAGRLLEEGRKLQVKINLLPEFTEEELILKFSKKKENRLLGVLNKKLAGVVEKESKRVHPNEDERASALTHMIQRLKVHPVSTVSFEEAQTTMGGVSTAEIDPETMESKLVPGLCFTGEVMDISGICGGYNLQWAWSTAHQAAEFLKS